jgi:hypothetical protein
MLNREGCKEDIEKQRRHYTGQDGLTSHLWATVKKNHKKTIKFREIFNKIVHRRAEREGYWCLM